MNNTKRAIFIFLILAFSGLISCTEKRHDLSKEYRLDHYAFTLVFMINNRELYLKVMREALQEKMKTLLDPTRGDTLPSDRQHLEAYDSLFLKSDELLEDPVKKIDSGRTRDTSPPDNFTKEEKEWLNEQVNNLGTVFRQIKGRYSDFNKYYEQAAYGDDNRIRSLALADSIRELDNKFEVISDSIILRSDRIFKDIYQVPEKKNAFRPAADLMEQSMKACDRYIALLEQPQPGGQQNIAPGKELRIAKDSIDSQVDQWMRLPFLGTKRSIWADALLLKFRDLLFSFRSYYEIRLPDPAQKGRIQKADLDFLKNLEDRMKRTAIIFLKL